MKTTYVISSQFQHFNTFLLRFTKIFLQNQENQECGFLNIFNFWLLNHIFVFSCLWYSPVHCVDVRMYERYFVYSSCTELRPPSSRPLTCCCQLFGRSVSYRSSVFPSGEEKLTTVTSDFYICPSTRRLDNSPAKITVCGLRAMAMAGIGIAPSGTRRWYHIVSSPTNNGGDIIFSVQTRSAAFSRFLMEINWMMSRSIISANHNTFLGIISLTIPGSGWWWWWYHWLVSDDVTVPD